MMSKTIRNIILTVLIFTLLLPLLFSCSQSDLVVLKTRPINTRQISYHIPHFNRYEYFDVLLNEKKYEDFFPIHLLGNIGELNKVRYNVDYDYDTTWDYRFNNGIVVYFAAWDGYYNNIVYGPWDNVNKRFESYNCYKYGGKSTKFNKNDLYSLKTELDESVILVEVFEDVFYRYSIDEEKNVGYLKSITFYLHDNVAITIQYRSSNNKNKSDIPKFIETLLDRNTAETYFKELSGRLSEFNDNYNRSSPEIRKEIGRDFVYDRFAYMNERALSEEEYKDFVAHKDFGEDFLPMEFFSENLYAGGEGAALFFEESQDVYRYAFFEPWSPDRELSTKFSIAANMVTVYAYDGESTDPKVRYEEYVSAMVKAVEKELGIGIEHAQTLCGANTVFMQEENIQFTNWEYKNKIGKNEYGEEKYDIYRTQVMDNSECRDIAPNSYAVYMLGNAAYVYNIYKYPDELLIAKLVKIIFFCDNYTVDIDLGVNSPILTSTSLPAQLKPLPEGASEDEMSENIDSIPDYYDLFIVSRAEEAVEYFTSLINEYKYQPKG